MERIYRKTLNNYKIWSARGAGRVLGATILLSFWREMLRNEHLLQEKWRETVTDE